MIKVNKKEYHLSIEVVNTNFKIYLCIKKRSFSAFLKATRTQDAIASNVT